MWNLAGLCTLHLMFAFDLLPRSGARVRVGDEAQRRPAFSSRGVKEKKKKVKRLRALALPCPSYDPFSLSWSAARRRVRFSVVSRTPPRARFGYSSPAYLGSAVGMLSARSKMQDYVQLLRNWYKRHQPLTRIEILCPQAQPKFIAFACLHKARHRPGHLSGSGPVAYPCTSGHSGRCSLRWSSHPAPYCPAAKPRGLCSVVLPSDGRP